MKLPKIMLGANPFHGVTYKSQEFRKYYKSHFINSERIFEIIDKAFQMGVRGFHSYTHEHEIEALLKAKDKYGDNLVIVSVVPDLYGAAARTVGTEEIRANATTLKSILKNSPKLLKAGITGELKDFVNSVFDRELELVKRTEPNFILLHGMLADIAAITEQTDILNMIKDKIVAMGSIPGINSHNLGVTFKKLNDLGITFPIIQTAFNKKGFMMNPSQAECVNVRQNAKDITFIAKKVLAGGVIPPKEALEYVFNEVGVQSAVLGIGTLNEAEESFSAAREVLGEKFHSSTEVTLS